MIVISCGKIIHNLIINILHINIHLITLNKKVEINIFNREKN